VVYHRVQFGGGITYNLTTTLKKNIVKLIDDEDKSWNVIVPEGLMNDIVKPYWDEQVRISGFEVKNKKRRILLDDIRPD